MRDRSGLVVVAVLGWIVCACAGTVRIASQERPDEGHELPPPSDFEVCRAASNIKERADVNGNGKVETIRVRALDGTEVCRGSDSDENGRFDTWDEVQHGNVTRRARDTDENGAVDEVTMWPDPMRRDCPVVFTDLDGDGKPEHVKMDVCGLTKKPAEQK